jgi:hypothetical protein
MKTHCLTSRFWMSILFQLALISLSSFVAQATSVRSLDLPDLVRQATLITDVTVTSVQPYLSTSSEETAVRTKVTFTLNRPALKGQVAAEFSLEFLGGTVGNRKMVVVGSRSSSPVSA